MKEKTLADSKDIFVQKNAAYANLLAEIKSKMHSARFRAAIAVNHELIQFYWEVGKLILERQEQAKWGDKLFDALAKDLKIAFPDTKGFSKTNLISMRLFAEHYPNAEFGQALPVQLTWTHHIALFRMIDEQSLAVKQWYAAQVIEQGWSYRKLIDAIRSNLYDRQADHAAKSTNFKDRLSADKSELAMQMIKDPYKFDFLTVGDDESEKAVHVGLLQHIREFLMELGQGFAFYGSHYPIIVSKKRFEVDLLMYNTKLHCYFVVEIKRGEFKPEYAGQLNFYLSAVDEQLKMPEDGPTIGLLLCEQKDRVIAEYALRRVESPMSVAQYELIKSLPAQLQKVLPTIGEIEAEFAGLSCVLSCTKAS